MPWFFFSIRPFASLWIQSSLLHKCVIIALLHQKNRHRERAGISDDVKTLTSYRCCLPPIPRPGLVLTLKVSSGFYIYGLPPSIKEQLSPLISIYKQPAYQQEIPNRSARVEFVSITDYSFTSSFPRPSSLTAVFFCFLKHTLGVRVTARKKSRTADGRIKRRQKSAGCTDIWEEVGQKWKSQDQVLKVLRKFNVRY